MRRKKFENVFTQYTNAIDTGWTDGQTHTA